jgi:hypothetical protein
MMKVYPKLIGFIVIFGLLCILCDVSGTSAAEYWTEPHGDYESRCREFLESSAAAPHGGMFAQIAKLELGRGPIDANPIRHAMETIRARHDGSDFLAAGLIRIDHYADSPLLPPGIRDQIRDVLTGFKYWMDEPGKDLLSMWSENHQIMYHAAEYLAGSRYPDDLFPNHGKTGRWHAEKARRRILRWIDLKARVGFSEWDSNVYYPITMAALLNLTDFAPDAEIAHRAAMLLDVMFFDMAVDSLRGTYGTSHGRTYQGAACGGGPAESTSPLQRIAWGMGALGSADNSAAVFLAASKKYRVARTIQAVGRDLPEELTNRERQSLLIEDAPRFGLRLDDPDDFFLISEGGKFSNLLNLETSLRVTDRINQHRYNVVIRPYAVALLGTYRELQRRGLPIMDLDRSSLARVDKLTYRTPDYQLSAAQDYRKGSPGYQQHIWQATLGPQAVVFTLNPSISSKYWVGRFPRVAQHKNLLVAVYNIPAEPPPGPKTLVPADASGNAMPSPGPAEEMPAGRTMAVLRRGSFDEVRQHNGWIFARKGQGYLALRCQCPAVWSPDGVLAGEGLIAEDRQNVWICQLGRAAVDGAFEDWTSRIATAWLEVRGLAVRYHAPGVGNVRFGWEGPLEIDDRAVPLGDYPRFGNPYCHSPYGSGRYDISCAERRLLIDFNTGRLEEGK